MARKKEIQVENNQTQQPEKERIMTFDEQRKEALRQKLIKNASDTRRRLHLTIETPYLNQPNFNNNVAGILHAGQSFVIEGEIDNGPNGKFWDIGNNRYINKDWEVKVY